MPIVAALIERSNCRTMRTFRPTLVSPFCGFACLRVGPVVSVLNPVTNDDDRAAERVTGDIQDQVVQVHRVLPIDGEKLRSA